MPPGLPLAIAASQSLSSPSHASGLGGRFWLQAIAPFAHAVVPAAQTPGLPVLHAWLPPGLPLSTAPSQSLSSASQTSALGGTFWLQAIGPVERRVGPAARTPGLPDF